MSTNYERAETLATAAAKSTNLEVKAIAASALATLALVDKLKEIIG